jgi:RNA polymerase sigma-70 factor (ECF subfamily)
MDPVSQEWVRDLKSAGPLHDRAVGRLHTLLLRVARFEAARRRDRVPGSSLSELDDLCVQAASDALMAVTRKLDSFRGAARFTTWASKFAILEFSTRLRRHVWRGRAVETDQTIWDRLPDSTPTALHGMEHHELLDALRRAVQEDLTERQRRVFQAAVIDEVPIDVLAERFHSSRGAVYKTLHDARRKLRAALTHAGYAEGMAR